jgi:DNA-binding LacI/PurR family transcriptional regulator/DNA-binding transcriptional regulator YhcF (GntR family)
MCVFMMSTTSVQPRIAEMADRLVADIDERRLQPGDRYLTTAEASKMLGVGNAIANRALQLLERRGIINRQQRRGAFIAVPPNGDHGRLLQRVHFLVHQKYLRAEGVGQDEVLLGIEHELPGVAVQISFLPVAREASFVQDLIDESLHAKRTDGFVLVRSSYETQRIVQDRRVPAVVYGTVYPSIDRIPTVTADMYRVGVLLAEYLLQRGHESIAYFNRQLVYVGDQQTMSGITSTLRAAGKGLGALTSRFLPTADEVCLAETASLLNSESPPTGFICRTVRMADAVREAVRRQAQGQGGKAIKDVDVCVCDYYLKPGEAVRYPWARPSMGSEAQGRHLARLLLNQVENRGAGAVVHECLPVELVLPLAAAI